MVTTDGSSGYLKLPDGLIQASTSLTVSLSFRAQPDTNGILFSTGHDLPSALNTAAMPVMYIGTDGKLYAQFWNGSVRPMTSAEPVNDGQWHTVTLTANGAVQGLFLDDDLRIGMAGSPTINNELFTCVPGALNQKWQISSDGTLYNPHSGRCLDDPGNSITNGTQLDIFDCLATSNEQWDTP